MHLPLRSAKFRSGPLRCRREGTSTPSPRRAGERRPPGTTPQPLYLTLAIPTSALRAHHFLRIIQKLPDRAKTGSGPFRPAGQTPCRPPSGRRSAGDSLVAFVANSGGNGSSQSERTAQDDPYLAGHSHPRTTEIYDRRRRRVTRNIVERIPFWTEGFVMPRHAIDHSGEL